MIAILINILAVAILCALVYLLLRPMVRGAIYFPTSPARTQTIMELARIGPDMRVIDLGSGDGRLLLAAAARGAYAVGYEVNPLLVWQSRRLIRQQGLSESAVVIYKSLWRADLRDFDVILVYGLPAIMRQLGQKILREARPGTLVVSNAFRFPNWEPVAQRENILLYRVPPPMSA